MRLFALLFVVACTPEPTRSHAHDDPTGTETTETGSAPEVIDVTTRAPEWTWSGEVPSTGEVWFDVHPVYDLTGDGVPDPVLLSRFVIDGTRLEEPLALPADAAAWSDVFEGIEAVADVNQDGSAELRRDGDALLGPFSGDLAEVARAWPGQWNEEWTVDVTRDGIPDYVWLRSDGTGVDVFAGPMTELHRPATFSYEWPFELETSCYVDNGRYTAEEWLMWFQLSVWLGPDIDGDGVQDPMIDPEGNFFIDCPNMSFVVPKDASGLLDVDAQLPAHPYAQVGDQSGDGVPDLLSSDRLFAGPLTWTGGAWSNGGVLVDRVRGTPTVDVDGDGYTDWLALDNNVLDLRRGGAENLTAGYWLRRWMLRDDHEVELQGSTVLISGPEGVHVFPLE